MKLVYRTIWLNGQVTLDTEHDRDWHIQSLRTNRAMAAVEVWFGGELLERLERQVVRAA